MIAGRSDRMTSFSTQLAAAGSPSIHTERGYRLLTITLAIITAFKLVLYFVVVPALGDRFGEIYGVGPADAYDWIAINIVDGHGFRLASDTGLTLVREPGYPYLLAGLGWLFHTIPNPAIVTNLIFSAGAALLVFTLARRLSTQPWVPLLAVLLFLLHPGVMIAELRAGVEILFILLSLGVLLLTCREMEHSRLQSFVRPGLMLGLTSCVRSTALLFPLVLPAYALIKERSLPAVGKSALQAALMLACAGMMLLPWTIRNYELTGRIIPTASVQGVAMQTGYYICTHEDGNTNLRTLDYAAVDERARLAASEGYRFRTDYYQMFYDPRDEVAFNSSLGADVLRHYRESPLLLVRCASENLVSFWFAGKNRLATLGNTIIQLPYLILGLAGLVLVRRTADRVTLGCLLLYVLYTVAVYVPIHAQARYSVPLIPIISIFAAIALARLLPRDGAAARVPAVATQSLPERQPT
jgi:hypothetical protein